MEDIERHHDIRKVYECIYSVMICSANQMAHYEQNLNYTSLVFRLTLEYFHQLIDPASTRSK